MTDQVIGHMCQLINSYEAPIISLSALLISTSSQFPNQLFLTNAPYIDSSLVNYLLKRVVEKLKLNIKCSMAPSQNSLQMGKPEEVISIIQLSKVLNEQVHLMQLNQQIGFDPVRHFIAFCEKFKLQMERKEDSQMHIWKQEELMLNQYFKKEENKILFNIFKIIYENQDDSNLNYQSIYNKQSSKFTSSKKKAQQKKSNFDLFPPTKDVAGFCKKLEKCGFINSAYGLTSLEKKIKLNSKVRSRKFQKKLTLKLNDSQNKELQQKGKQMLMKRSRLNSVMQGQESGRNFGEGNQGSSKRQCLQRCGSRNSGICECNKEQVNGDQINTESILQKQESSRNALQFQDIKIFPQNQEPNKCSLLRDETIERQNQVFNLFQRPHLTMREGIIRVLEQNIDPEVLRVKTFENDKDDQNSDHQSSDNNEDDEELKEFDIPRPSFTEPTKNRQSLISIDMEREQNGLFAIADLACALNMHNDDKTMGRVFSDVRKVNLQQIGIYENRNAKIHRNKFYLKKREVKVERKEKSGVGAGQVKEENNEFVKRRFQLIDLNNEAYELIEKLQENQVIAKNDPLLAEYSSKEQTIINYFRTLIQDGKANQNQRSQSIDTINRYIFCLNLVYQRELISMVELKHEIYENLDERKYQIDKKTLKKIVENLKQDNIVKTREVHVTIGQQNFVPLLVMNPKCERSHSDLKTYVIDIYHLKKGSSTEKGSVSNQRTKRVQPSRKCQSTMNKMMQDLSEEEEEELVSSDSDQQKFKEEIIKEQKQGARITEQPGVEVIKQKKLNEKIQDLDEIIMSREGSEKEEVGNKELEETALRFREEIQQVKLRQSQLAKAKERLKGDLADDTEATLICTNLVKKLQKIMKKSERHNLRKGFILILNEAAIPAKFTLPSSSSPSPFSYLSIIQNLYKINSIQPIEESKVSSQVPIRPKVNFHEILNTKNAFFSEQQVMDRIKSQMDKKTESLFQYPKIKSLFSHSAGEDNQNEVNPILKEKIKEKIAQFISKKDRKDYRVQRDRKYLFLEDGRSLEKQFKEACIQMNRRGVVTLEALLTQFTLTQATNEFLVLSMLDQGYLKVQHESEFLKMLENKEGQEEWNGQITVEGTQKIYKIFQK